MFWTQLGTCSSIVPLSLFLLLSFLLSSPNRTLPLSNSQIRRLFPPKQLPCSILNLPTIFLRSSPSNHRKILCYLLLILTARVCTFQLHFFFISGVLRRRTVANGVGKGEVRSCLCSSSCSFLSKLISHFLFSLCYDFRPPL